ncbi:hypothetical protein [Merismopedia glauca]|uniref:hypothetical protein n=1 Tax=Merismopedia glauca TaxID=292586 RepID=UPI0015E766DA|nr:hypothetical protein [Merismopedia glauca]
MSDRSYCFGYLPKLSADNRDLTLDTQAPNRGTKVTQPPLANKEETNQLEDDA